MLIKERKNSHLLSYIAQQLESEIVAISPLTGGDIAYSYKIDTAEKAYFLKVNHGSTAEKMTLAEQYGLETIESTKTIAVPHIYLQATVDAESFLLMEYIERKQPSNQDFQLLGKHLSQLHLISSQQFGFSHDNFIGLLPQKNHYDGNWGEFYANQRLLPQCQLAHKKGLLSHHEIPDSVKVVGEVNSITQNIKPSLLHGDLWGGNYLIAKNGKPYLIDPAVYYGDATIDLAMSKLFGGFSNNFYETYHQTIPKTTNYEKKIEIYQLYYLLVHLNMFGSSYRSSVLSILKKYFL